MYVGYLEFKAGFHLKMRQVFTRGHLPIKLCVFWLDRFAAMLAERKLVGMV